MYIFFRSISFLIIMQSMKNKETEIKKKTKQIQITSTEKNKSASVTRTLKVLRYNTQYSEKFHTTATFFGTVSIQYFPAFLSWVMIIDINCTFLAIRFMTVLSRPLFLYMFLHFIQILIKNASTKTSIQTYIFFWEWIYLNKLKFFFRLC